MGVELQSTSIDPARTIAETLSDFAAGLDYEAIPAAARAAAKLHLLDAVGVAYASASFEFARRYTQALIKPERCGPHRTFGRRY